MQKPQLVQENKYNFPYHYTPTYHNNNFKQTYNIKWGYEYISYLNFVIKIIKKFKFDSLIDIGCGDGRLISELNKSLPNKNLTGIDYSNKAVKLANAMNPGLDYKCTDITKNNLNTKYDVATLVETLEHIPLDKIDNFIASTSNLIKSNGYLVITVPSDNEKIDSHHYQNFNKNTLDKYLKNYFKIKKLFYINKTSKLIFIISKMLTNKYFILNNNHLLNKIYNYYLKNYLLAKKHNARRICVVCKKYGSI